MRVSNRWTRLYKGCNELISISNADTERKGAVSDAEDIKIHLTKLMVLQLPKQAL